MSIEVDRLLHEAFEHGRTQERLREAAECLRRVKALACDDPARRSSLKNRLLEIEADVCITLKRLSKATGGVIDDMAPSGDVLNPGEQESDIERDHR